MNYNQVMWYTCNRVQIKVMMPQKLNSEIMGFVEIIILKKHDQKCLRVHVHAMLEWRKNQKDLNHESLEHNSATI